MNEDLNKSLLFNAPLPVFGIGIVAPLWIGGSLRTAIILGIMAIIMVPASCAALAALRSRTSRNGRTGIAVLITGGLLMVAEIILGALFPATRVPVETIAPLMLVTATLAVLTDAYEVKKKLTLALIDGAAIGLSFLLLLCLAAILRDFLGNNAFNNHEAFPWFQPVRMIALVPGALLIAALVAALLPKKKRGAA